MHERKNIRVALTYDELDLLTMLADEATRMARMPIDEFEDIYGKLEGAKAKLDPMRYKCEIEDSRKNNA